MQRIKSLSQIWLRFRNFKKMSNIRTFFDELFLHHPRIFHAMNTLIWFLLFWPVWYWKSPSMSKCVVVWRYKCTACITPAHHRVFSTINQAGGGWCSKIHQFRSFQAKNSNNQLNKQEFIGSSIAGTPPQIVDQSRLIINRNLTNNKNNRPDRVD